MLCVAKELVGLKPDLKYKELATSYVTFRSGLAR